MEPLLTARGVTVRFDGKPAVESTDLEVGRAEIVTVIGHNGAGKSSLLKALHGHVPMTGTVTVGGEDISGWTPERRLQAGIALVPQGHQVFRGLTVKENLELAGLQLRRTSPDDLASVYDLFPVLQERSAQRAGTLSGGQQQMLAIGMGLIVQPRLLLVDEPSIGLAPTLVQRVMDALADVRTQRECSVLLVEQNVSQALQLADRAYGMVRGEIVAQAPAAEFAERYDLMEIM